MAHQKPKRASIGIDCCGEYFCDILGQATDAVFICDIQGRLLLINPAFEALLESGDVIGLSYDRLRPVEIGQLVTEENAAVLATGEIRKFECTIESARGALRTFEVTKGIYHDREGRRNGIFGCVREISDRLAIEQEIIDTSDEEKQRLGREIRENFCQHLVGISLLGNALYEELARLGLEQADDARQIAQLVKEVVSEVRAVEKGLSVIHLEQGGGLVEALADLAEQTRAPEGAECVFEQSGAVPALEPKTAMYLFRIAQEAVHAFQADNAVVRLKIRLANKRDAVVLAIKSVGMATAGSEAFRGRFAFPMMGHRSRAIGASLDIKGRRGGGLEVICTLPKRRKYRGGRAR